MDSTLSSWLLFLASLSGGIAVISFLTNCFHHQERKEQFAGEAKKMKDILKKVRESVIG